MKLHLPAFVIVTISCFACANAVFWGDLRCTFGFDQESAFLKMPRTAKEALAAGYKPEGGTTLEDCEAGPFRGIRWVHPDDFCIVILLDHKGIIVGLQAQVPQSDVLIKCNPYRFDQVPMFQTVTTKNGKFFVVTMYFVPPSDICKKGRTEADLIEQGTGTGLFYQNGPTADELIEVPLQRKVALTQGWSNNKCFPGMGTHCLWQTDKYEDHHCTLIRPTIVLYDPFTDMIHGAGFTFVGPIPTCKRFEVPPADIVNKIYDPTPPCLKDVSENCGGATLHCYFIPKPWDIKCT